MPQAVQKLLSGGSRGHVLTSKANALQLHPTADCIRTSPFFCAPRQTLPSLGVNSLSGTHLDSLNFPASGSGSSDE